MLIFSTMVKRKLAEKLEKMRTEEGGFRGDEPKWKGVTAKIPSGREVHVSRVDFSALEEKVLLELFERLTKISQRGKRKRL
jgi:hypothetical protein